MGVGVGRDLGQVGDAQDLVAPGQRPQAAPDRVRAPAADARVDLVEDEGRRVVGLGQDALDGQRDARQLAARRDPGQRPGRLARVRREAVDDLVDAARIERDGVAVELDRGLVRGRPARRPERDLEDAGREAEVVAGRAPTASVSAGAGRGAGGRQGRGRGGDLGRAGAASSRSRRARSPSRPRSRSASAAARSPWAMTAASSSP